MAMVGGGGAALPEIGAALAMGVEIALPVEDILAGQLAELLRDWRRSPRIPDRRRCRADRR